MWNGTDRRSPGSHLARNLVIVKEQADEFESELEQTPRWRRRDREQQLLHSLGATDRGRSG